MKLLIVLTLLIAGCAIEPDSIRIEAQHTSHLLQHQWMTEWSRSQPGFDAIGVDAHWQPTTHFYIDVGEYYTPNRLDCQNEVFEARAGYEIPLKK